MHLIDGNLERVFDFNGNMLEQYKLLERLMDILNNLCVKWKLTDTTQYFYRTSGRTLTVKLIDLRELNRAFFTLDTIWFAIRLNDIL
jgi:hypothetical protein